MESSIEFLAAVAFLLVGLSHIAQPRGWCELFVRLRDQGVPGVFAVALITLPMGLLIVSFHNVLTGLPALLTVIGWAYCAKCLVYFVYPRAGLAALAKISVERPKKFIVAGVLLIVLSGACWSMWLTRS